RGHHLEPRRRRHPPQRSLLRIRPGKLAPRPSFPARPRIQLSPAVVLVLDSPRAGTHALSNRLPAARFHVPVRHHRRALLFPRPAVRLAALGTDEAHLPDPAPAHRQHFLRRRQRGFRSHRSDRAIRRAHLGRRPALGVRTPAIRERLRLLPGPLAGPLANQLRPHLRSPLLAFAAMNPVTKIVQAMGPGSYVVQAVIASLIGAALLLAFIMGRRAARRRYFGRRDARAQMLRRQLPEILAGRIMPEAWRRDPLDDRILEAILLDCLEVAEREEAEQIRHCLRISGLLDKRIHQARHRRGWRRLNTLVALGRMRCPEAIPALAEGLDDQNEQVAIAAARGLGRYGLPEAAEPILERLEHGGLRRLPANVLQSALYHCCRERPSLLMRCIHFADDRLRPLLARVLAEVASAELGEDLVQLASDPLPEVRASAARAMAGARPRLALA